MSVALGPVLGLPARCGGARATKPAAVAIAARLPQAPTARVRTSNHGNPLRLAHSSAQRSTCRQMLACRAAQAGPGSGITKKTKVMKQTVVVLDRPLGIVFGERKNGDLRVDELVEDGNAAKSGLILKNDLLAACGPTEDDLFDCKGKTFDQALDVLGGSPDSATMVVVVEREEEVVEEVEEDFSDVGRYWKNKRERRNRPPSEMRRTAGLLPEDIVVEKKIGGGSFGDVFKGSWKGDPIVLKRCNAQVFGAEELLELEMQINEVVSSTDAAAACAPYIGCCEVSIYEAKALYDKKLPEGLWLVWRLEGENTLKALLTEKDKELKKVGELLSVEGGQAAAATIVRQVLEDLALLHAARVVHKDVKPANLVFSTEDARFKLIDLGAAAEFTAGGKHLGVKLGECPHDPLYCPPEKDLLPADAAAEVSAVTVGQLWDDCNPALYDMHAVGVILMQCACPSLRSEKGLEAFVPALAKCGNDLAAWRSTAKAAQEGEELGDAGWDLAAKLLTPRGTGSGPPTAAEALAHPFLQ